MMSRHCRDTEVPPASALRREICLVLLAMRRMDRVWGSTGKRLSVVTSPLTRWRKRLFWRIFRHTWTLHDTFGLCVVMCSMNLMSTKCFSVFGSPHESSIIIKSSTLSLVSGNCKVFRLNSAWHCGKHTVMPPPTPRLLSAMFWYDMYVYVHVLSIVVLHLLGAFKAACSHGNSDCTST